MKNEKQIASLADTCRWAQHKGYEVKTYGKTLVVFKTFVSTGIYNALTNRLTFHSKELFDFDPTQKKCLITNPDDCLFC